MRKRTTWTDQDKNLLKILLKNHSIGECARIMGKPYQATVYRVRILRGERARKTNLSKNIKTRKCLRCRQTFKTDQNYYRCDNCREWCNRHYAQIADYAH